MTSPTPRVAIVVQARTSSARLPGKVLMPLAGEPAIVRMLERVARVRGAEWRIMATSADPSDDALADACRARGFDVARGSLPDVLERMHDAVPEAADVVVRLTGDCPLVDAALVEEHVRVFIAEQPEAEYVTNAAVRSMPDGLDVEVVSRHTLARAHREATEKADREHVLTWVRRNAQTRSITQRTDLSALRLTLDTARDYEVIAEIYATLWPGNPAFEMRDVYALLVERPELLLVAGTDEIDTAEREAWCRRIRDHLAEGEAHH